MNSRVPIGSIRTALARHHERLRRALALRTALRAAAFAAVPVALAALVGIAFTWGVAASWVRFALVGIFLIACVAWAVLRFLARAPRFDAYLEHVESRFPEIRSWLRNAVDFGGAGSTPGTSSDLAHAVLDETTRRVEGLPLATLRPRLEPARPLALMAGCALALIVAGLVFPARLDRSWRTLWNPALAAPPVTLTVEPGSVEVTPGASLTVWARVLGTDRAPKLNREHGRAVEGVLDGRAGDAKLWRFDLAQLTRAEDYHVRVASTRSPDYHIGLAGEPVPVSFDVEYRAPGYARLPVQRGSSLRGDLAALRGTRAKIVATFDRDLARLEATIPGAGAVAWRALSARRWQGELTLDRDAEYELHAVSDGGEGRFRYRMSALADAPPVLAVRLPTGDVDLPAGQQIPLDVLGQDDLGLAELKLQYRKDPAAPWADLPLARFAQRPREAEVRARWDASPLAMLPGETATFRFVLLDEASNRAESPAFELRFPSLGELYEDIDQKQERVQTTLEKVADQAKELQKSLDKMTRQQQQAQRSPRQQEPAFERSEELKNALERQQEMARQLDQASQQLKETLEQAQEREAFNEELANKLREMAKLMEQVQSKEFQEALRRMQEALERFDQRQLENQLPQWKAENQEMMKNLERTIELLKQLRQEEQIEALAQRAEELQKRQEQLNREHAQQDRQRPEEQSRQSKDSRDSRNAEQKDSEQLAREQEQAANETEQLSKDVDEMAQQLQKQNEQEELEKTAEELRKEAEQPQRQAAESAQQKQSGQAQQSGQKASEGLKQAASRLQKLSANRQQQRQQVDLAAVRRAAQDLVTLQRETDANLQQTTQPMEQRANRQTDLSEGVSRIADSLFTLSQRTPFISPKLSESLGRAKNQLSQSGKDLAAGNRARGEQTGREGGSALNEAVLELRASEAQMCQTPGEGSGQQQGTGQQMSQLGQQQQQLNQRSQSLTQRLTQQMRLSAGDRDEMQRLSQEQARLRQQLEQIQRDDEARKQLLGRLDAAHREMKEVEEALAEGSFSGELEQKQTRILSRLLDAQRSMNRRDFDPQREARPGVEVEQRSAAELPAEMLRETDRLRLDLLKAESDRYPAQYRAFIEAYLRSLNGTRR
jgi:hypothetical protein